jgi:aminoglycoside phosphotransferase (APT) family kinase protein
MHWDASLPDELVERIWRDPNDLLASGSKLQYKPRCSVARVDGYGGSFVWKRHNWGGIGRTLRKALSRSVAKKCWTDGRSLHEAGVPTPQPRLYLERRIGPVNTCSYLLTDYVAGTSLYRFMRFEQPARPVIEQLAQQAAAIWQQLDDLRIQHNDFQTENFLVDPAGKLWLIDLERLRRCRRTEDVRSRQIRDINDLLHPRNWRANPEAGELFRREILQTRAAAEALANHGGGAHPLSRPVFAVNRRTHLATVLIPCFNAADTILTCLRSVRDMADEILVADAGSTDETLALVRRFGGCRIVQRHSGDAAEFESWACQQARHAWILRVLPNEQVNSELGREVQELLASEPAQDAFLISRSPYFRGRPLKHGGFEHDPSLRLFRKDAVRFEIRGGQVEVSPRSDPTGPLRYPLACELCSDIRQYLGDMIRAAADAAEAADSQGRRPKLRTVLWQVPWQLFRSYVLRGGWVDGWAGLHASFLSACAIYLREAMLWERQQTPLRSSANDEGRELKVFSGTADADVPVAYPFILAAEEAPHAESEGRQMRPAA